MRALEIGTVEEFVRAAEVATSQGRGMRGWQTQDLDLSAADDVLRRLDARGSLFLGCTFANGTEESLRARGALVFPRVPDVPFDPWRASLYTPEELYDGLDRRYEDTPDGSIYAWTRGRTSTPTLHDALAMSLHDNSIDDALAEYVDGRRIVGVMGGHALQRGEPAYDDAAVLGWELARRGLTVATGGGPGAMEAANLGASLADATRADLGRALKGCAQVPAFRPSVQAWARAAFAAVAGLPRSDLSLGVPTWFYGHEPPNPFAGAVAKYFRNAIREDTLLHLARAGLVFLPGAAGTVQEIFQAACEGYYSAAGTATPLVLVGREYWTRTLPAWPLLKVLGRGRPFGADLQLVDSPAQALALLGDQPTR